MYQEEISRIWIQKNTQSNLNCTFASEYLRVALSDEPVSKKIIISFKATFYLLNSYRYTSLIGITILKWWYQSCYWLSRNALITRPSNLYSATGGLFARCTGAPTSWKITGPLKNAHTLYPDAVYSKKKTTLLLSHCIFHCYLKKCW